MGAENNDESTFDDGTTSFGDGPVDGLVFLPPSDSPELRMKPRTPTPQAPRRSAPRNTPVAPAPTSHWTPGPVNEAAPERTPGPLGKPLRVLLTVALAALPLLAAAWLVRLGLSLVGG